MNKSELQTEIAKWQTDKVEELFSSIKDPSLAIFLKSNLVSSLENHSSHMLKEIEKESFNIVGDFLDFKERSIGREDIEVDPLDLSKEILETLKKRFLPNYQNVRAN